MNKNKPFEISLVVAVPVVLFAVLLAGCGGEKPPEPKPTPALPQKEAEPEKPRGDTGPSRTPTATPEARVPAQPVDTIVRGATPATEIEAASPEAGIAYPTPKPMQLGGLSMQPPREWVDGPSNMPPPVRQYMVPSGKGAAQITVYHIAPEKRIPAQRRVDDWVKGFVQPGSDESPEPEIVIEERDGLKITKVYLEGTMLPPDMYPPPNPPEQPREGYALYGAVIEGGPEGTLYAVMREEAGKVREQRDALDLFVDSAVADE